MINIPPPSIYWFYIGIYALIILITPVAYRLLGDIWMRKFLRHHGDLMTPKQACMPYLGVFFIGLSLICYIFVLFVIWYIYDGYATNNTILEWLIIIVASLYYFGITFVWVRVVTRNSFAYKQSLRVNVIIIGTFSCVLMIYSLLALTDTRIKFYMLFL